jgi:molybdenum cofactor cytidylyltransferase
VKIVAIVLAAGSATRMGVDKLALPWEGSTVLERAVAPFLASARLAEVVLVVQPGFRVPENLAGARVVENPEHREGMGASLRAGVAAADADAWLVALGDMPRVASSTVEAVIDAVLEQTHGLVVPAYRERRGHPVAITAKYREALLQVRGDFGARGLLRDHPGDLRLLPVDDPGVVFDLDTPSDLDPR